MQGKNIMDSSGHGKPCEAMDQDDITGPPPSESLIELEESELYDEDEDEEDYLDEEPETVCPFVPSSENLQEIEAWEKYNEFWGDSCWSDPWCGDDYVQK